MNEDLKLHHFYKIKSKEWIFQKTYRNYYIEDDEILDLDSLSVGSNEDTWLYSNDEISLKYDDDDDDDSDMKRNVETIISPTSSSNLAMLDASNFLPDIGECTSSISSLIDISNCSDSLIHLPDVSEATVDRYLFVTPKKEDNVKSYQNIALCNQLPDSQTSLEGEKNLNSPFSLIRNHNHTLREYKSIRGLSYKNSDFVFSETPYHMNCADTNHVLNSVENKPFAITTMNSGINLNSCSKAIFGNELTDDDRKVGSRDENSSLKAFVDDIKIERYEGAVTKRNDVNDCDSNTWFKAVPSRNSLVITHENDENDYRSVAKKDTPFSQSTPMLLNRYLKYNKSIEDSKHFCKWRTSGEFLKADAMQIVQDGEDDEMNISYIKNASRSFPCENESTVTEISTNLNATYSKSNCNLNSTYAVHSDDDQISSASESSITSAASTTVDRSYSIQYVQKKSERQEESLKTLIHSNHRTESSQNSDVSSSSESVYPLFDCNTGSMGTEMTRVNQTAQKMIYSNGTNIISCALPKSPSKRNTLGGQYKVVENSQKEQARNDIVSSNKILSIEDPSPLKKISVLNKFSCSSLTTGRRPSIPQPKESVIKHSNHAESKLDSWTTEEKTQRSNVNISTKCDEVNRTAHSNRSASPASFSQIPRLSSKIPKLKTSNSCTRYNRN